MIIGTINNFKVLRKTALGYILGKDNEEYFLHFNDCQNEELEIDTIVEAFIYKDKKERLTATTKTPKITTDRFALCEVVEVVQSGVFIDIEINKDLLVSKYELPQNRSFWPQPGDLIPCMMTVKNDQLFGKLLSKTYFSQVEQEKRLDIGALVKGYVYRVFEQGMNLVDADFNSYFVYLDNLSSRYRIGEAVDLKITTDNGDDYTAIVNRNKSLQIETDAQLIYDYLKSHNGEMAFSSKSNSETIRRIFKMSKVAFKNALGHLYKEHKVLLFDEKTVINQENK